MSLTIDQVKEKKISIESSISKILQSFEKETDSIVSYIDVVREIKKKKGKKNEVMEYASVPEPMREGPIQTVNINLRFDI